MGWKDFFKEDSVDKSVENSGIQPQSVGGKNVDNSIKEEDHKHEWKFIAKTYGAPRHEGQFSAEEKGTVEKTLFGVTTFLWECVVCKMLRKEEMLGSEGSQLEDLLEKAEKFGPQYIQRNGFTFVIGKYNLPQQQQPGFIPLK